MRAAIVKYLILYSILSRNTYPRATHLRPRILSPPNTARCSIIGFILSILRLARRRSFERNIRVISIVTEMTSLSIQLLPPDRSRHSLHHSRSEMTLSALGNPFKRNTNSQITPISLRLAMPMRIPSISGRGAIRERRETVQARRGLKGS